jgi:hypothetical protein
MSSGIKKSVELEIDIVGYPKGLKLQKNRDQGWIPAKSRE